jgi:hypothetical protein
MPLPIPPVHLGLWIVKTPCGSKRVSLLWWESRVTKTRDTRSYSTCPPWFSVHKNTVQYEAGAVALVGIIVTIGIIAAALPAWYIAVAIYTLLSSLVNAARLSGGARLVISFRARQWKAPSFPGAIAVNRQLKRGLAAMRCLFVVIVRRPQSDPYSLDYCGCGLFALAQPWNGFDPIFTVGVHPKGCLVFAMDEPHWRVESVAAHIIVNELHIITRVATNRVARRRERPVAAYRVRSGTGQ